MDKLIFANQYVFLTGRFLVDRVVVVNVIVDLVKRSKKSCLIFKVDFEKSYDSVSWSFLICMFGRFRFNEKWGSWMKACVFSSNLAVLVNGCLTQEIHIQRELKQGDPIAPQIFLLVVEGLSGLIFKAILG